MIRTQPLLALLLTAVIGRADLSAATIIKLGLGSDSLRDIELVDGVLSTVDDTVGATTGDQNTEVRFLGVLSGTPAIDDEIASFMLDDVTLAGVPAIVGSTVLQATDGGNFALYNPSDELLLTGTFGEGSLSGSLGGTATGGFLTTTFGAFTGGSLLPILQDSNMLLSTISISLTNVNEGVDMSIGGDGRINDFRADATANIGAQVVPEPGTMSLSVLALLALITGMRRR